MEWRIYFEVRIVGRHASGALNYRVPIRSWTPKPISGLIGRAGHKLALGSCTVFRRIERIDDLPLIKCTLRMCVRRHHEIPAHKRERGGVAELQWITFSFRHGSSFIELSENPAIAPIQVIATGTDFPTRADIHRITLNEIWR